MSLELVAACVLVSISLFAVGYAVGKAVAASHYAERERLCWERARAEYASLMTQASQKEVERARQRVERIHNDLAAQKARLDAVEAGERVKVERAPRGACGIRGCPNMRPHSHVADLARRIKERT